MKKIATLVLFIIGTQVLVNAQTAEEIVKTYIENIGGEEALKKIKSVKMTAKVNAQGMELPITMINMADGKMLMKFELQGQEVVQQAFDGETAWGVNFMTQKAEKSDAEDTENIKREAGDFPEPFLDYVAKGYKVEALGKETVEGVECFKVKLIKKPQVIDGKEVENVTFYYFDTENYVPIVTETEIKSGQMKGSFSQTVFSDYQEVEGVYFAFSIDQKLKGQDKGQPVAIEEIEINPEIDESIFKFPVTEEAAE